MARIDAETGTAPLASRHRVGAETSVSICCANLAAIVFLQRIVVPLGAEQSVSCLLPIAWLSMTYLLWTGLAIMDGTALFGCTAFMAAALLSQLLGGTDFSITSLGLLVAIYLLCPVRIALSPSNYRRVLRFYQSCMMIVALATLGQFAFQLLGLGMPILEQAVPERLIAKNFVYLQEIVWESGLYKPNGIVMLEASFLSQFLALALVVEYWVFRRPRLLLLFGAVLLLTFSGTGMSLAAITLAYMVWRRGADRYALMLAGAVAVMAMGLMATGLFEAISGRVGEFSDRDASASIRFVAPFERVSETLKAGDTGLVLWGAGAGFIDREVGFAWNPPVKVWVEYGLITFAAYWLFLATLMRSTPSATLAVALALEYLLFGGGALLQPPVVFACFFLGIGYSVARAAPVQDRKPDGGRTHDAGNSRAGLAPGTGGRWSAGVIRDA